MSLLRLSVLGSPEIFLDGIRLTFPLRKAQALLLYLAVEGGMHSRSKLAARSRFHGMVDRQEWSARPMARAGFRRPGSDDVSAAIPCFRLYP